MRDVTTELSLKDIARWYNPILQGWINYYGKYCRSALYPMMRHFNKTLVAWAMKKYRRLRKRKTRAGKFIERISKENRNLFAHWRCDMQGAFAWWERYEPRGSRTVLRGASGEVPLAYSPAMKLIHMASKGHLRYAHRLLTCCLQLATEENKNHLPDDIVEKAISQLRSTTF